MDICLHNLLKFPIYAKKVLQNLNLEKTPLLIVPLFDR